MPTDLGPDKIGKINFLEKLSHKMGRPGPGRGPGRGSGPVGWAREPGRGGRPGASPSSGVRVTARVGLGMGV